MHDRSVHCVKIAIPVLLTQRSKTWIFR